LTDPAPLTMAFVRQRTAGEPQSAADGRRRSARVNPLSFRATIASRRCPAAMNNDIYTPFEGIVDGIAKPVQDQPEFLIMRSPKPDQCCCRRFAGREMLGFTALVTSLRAQRSIHLAAKEDGLPPPSLTAEAPATTNCSPNAGRVHRTPSKRSLRWPTPLLWGRMDELVADDLPDGCS